jgi:uncharacterized protein YbbC (DUF1343 family)
MTRPSIRIGLERCLEEPPPHLRGAKFGLLMNQASLNHECRYACDLFAERFPGQLAALFTPQHGLWCEQQANMLETAHGWHEPLQLPIYSLYSESRRPTAEMLRGLECLVVDLQDVGTRVYTFAWTLLECMQACTEAKIPLIVLDRPNPIGGTVAEGPLLLPQFKSFVGGVCIPLRHGLTLGELAQLFLAEADYKVDLTVVAMDGWQRDMLFNDTGRIWVPPSPNMPRLETALLYPGQVMLEGTNLSEGRGTTIPFECVGAPFIDPYLLARELTAQVHPGIAIRPIRFVPTFDKWRGESCGGIGISINQPSEVRSVQFTVDLLATVSRLYPEEFRWLPPPYEYEYNLPPIDILYGSSELRTLLSSQPTLQTVQVLAVWDLPLWLKRSANIRLYN